jgi:TAL effector repeat
MPTSRAEAEHRPSGGHRFGFSDQGPAQSSDAASARSSRSAQSRPDGGRNAEATTSGSTADASAGQPPVSATGAGRLTPGAKEALVPSGSARPISAILTEAPYGFGADDVAKIQAKGGQAALEAVRRCCADLYAHELGNKDLVRIAAKEGGAEALQETCDLYRPLSLAGFPAHEIVRLAAFGHGAQTLQNALLLSGHLSNLGIPDDTIVTAIHYSVIEEKQGAAALDEMVAAMEDPSQERILRDLVALFERHAELTQYGSGWTSQKLIELAKSGNGAKELAWRDKSSKRMGSFKWNPHAWKSKQASRPGKPGSETSAERIQEISAELMQAPYGFEERDVTRIAKAGGAEALEAVKRYYPELSVMLMLPTTDIVAIASGKDGVAALGEICKHHQSLVDVGFPSFEVVQLARTDEGAYALSNALRLYNALVGRGFSSDTAITAIHYSHRQDEHAMKELFALIEDPAGDTVLKDLVMLLERRDRLGDTISGVTLIKMARSGKARKELDWRDKLLQKDWKRYGFAIPNPHAWKDPGVRRGRAPMEAPSNELLQEMTTALTAPPYNLGESAVASIAKDGGGKALEAVRNNYVELRDAGFSPSAIVNIARSQGGDEALREAWNLCQPLRAIGFPMSSIERMASCGDGAHVLQQALPLYSRLDDRGFSHERIIAAIGNSNLLTTEALLRFSVPDSPRVNEQQMKDLIALLERFDDLKEARLAQTHEDLRNIAGIYGNAQIYLKRLEERKNAGRSR